MQSSVSLNQGWLIGTIVTAVFVICYPIVLAIIARKRLHVSWRYFWYGALIFFLFQLITRIPLVIWLQTLFASQLKASLAFRIAWIVALALTAGLAEEIGRYIGYRWLMKREEKTWSKAIMYGIGHGGLESILFVGGQVILGLVGTITLASLLASNPASLPAGTREVAMHQLAAINAQPVWLAFLGGWERLWTLPFHIAMSVVVLQVFRRNNIAWLWLAILLHACLDFLTAGLPLWLGARPETSLVVEGVVTVSGLFALWLIWRLRDKREPTQTATPTALEPGTSVS
ncbi:YhfC family intramembrane metalloprotease [Ktedonosporobacter rubrisoli]|uniref:YhfC family intramembrane metalloprotease n=1 Tax=Ktedonosporobacter rubrisoli TaxID=2509675 RepID=A0A4P6K2I9_KTERU|nr:YhfC family glutamic-type intramembrane protease [Ktedonosporobacter rubrisoli]QBD82359.1 YhfC family intramembrane metalloprotease [Ktedonosporobacter rubrisoli]